MTAPQPATPGTETCKCIDGATCGHAAPSPVDTPEPPAEAWNRLHRGEPAPLTALIPAEAQQDDERTQIELLLIRNGVWPLAVAERCAAAIAARPSADTETLRRAMARDKPWVEAQALDDAADDLLSELLNDDGDWSADDLFRWITNRSAGLRRAALAARPGDTETLRRILLKHHPIAHSETGALKGCRCGAVKLGQDVIHHVVTEVRAALDGTQ